MTDLLNNLSTLIETAVYLGPILALLAGILTSFSPCCLSSVPLVIAYVGGTDSKKKALKLSLVFVLGSTIMYTALAIVAVSLNQLVIFGGTWLYYLLSFILIIMVLQMWEVINIIPSTNLMSKVKQRGYKGSFLTGILSGFFAIPCSTPVLIIILTIAGTQGSLLYGIILLLLYSFGNSFLTIAAGTSFGALNEIRKSENYSKIYFFGKIIFGILALLLALYLFYLAI